MGVGKGRRCRQRNGQWHKHIENIVVIALQVIGIMRKLKYTFLRVAINHIYISYVLPILEYSAVVCDDCTMQDSSTLEKLQNSVLFHWLTYIESMVESHYILDVKNKNWQNIDRRELSGSSAFSMLVPSPSY